MKPANRVPVLNKSTSVLTGQESTIAIPFTMKRGDDGFLHIEGLASDDTLDLDGQRCDPDWLDTAIPKWLQGGGNFREMHQPSAVGKGNRAEKVGTGWKVGGIIVDPVAITKTETGVYSMLSVGIKNATVVKDASAPNGRINAGDVVEISLVDRGANPSAKMSIVKSVDGVLTPTDAFKSTPEMDLEAHPHDSIENSPVTPELPVHGTFKPCTACNGLGVTSDLNDPQECEHCHGTKIEPEVSNANFTGSVSGHDNPSANGEAGDPKGVSAQFVKSVVTEIEKGHDPAQLNAVRENLVSLITAELAEMSAGNEDEMSDVYQLLCSLGDFLSWWEDEADEGEVTEPFSEGDDDMDMISLGVSADIVKAAKADGATDDDKTALKSALVKALLGDEVPDITKALSGATEAIEGLTERLNKVEQMAAPGGPAKRASEAQRVAAPGVELLKSQIAELDRLALTMTNPDDARGYRDDAQAKRLQLASIVSA